MTMSRAPRGAMAILAAAALLAACSSTRSNTGTTASSSASAGNNAFFSRAEYDRQRAEEKAVPQGNPDTPWLQAISPTYVDTAKYAKPAGKWRICFSNASVDNPWRGRGGTAKKARGKVHPRIASFTRDRARGEGGKQNSDSSALSGQ